VRRSSARRSGSSASNQPLGIDFVSINVLND
jgi:hypothetical protein